MRNARFSPKLSAILALATAFGALGCVPRKAPGPFECRAFALSTLGLAQNLSTEELRLRPDIARQVDELTGTCLTTPYDYPLLQCVELTHSRRSCLHGFQLRQSQAHTALTPRT